MRARYHNSTTTTPFEPYLVRALNHYYYSILNVSIGADRSELKRAYRTMARKYHPDVNPVGETRMRLLNEAYAYLTK